MIYLDHAATTNVCPTAADAAYRIMTSEFGNPSSLHRMGLEAERIIKHARNVLAKTISCDENELYFTSSGTEADNLAILGGLKSSRQRIGHIITTAIEHKAVLNPIDELVRAGYSVTLLSPNQQGVVLLEDLEKALRPDTVLVSMMAVNNETGAVQPYMEACEMVKRFNPTILFHCDAIQLLGKLPISMKRFKADYVSFSGHKVHAPKGVGALFVRKGLHPEPLLFGGGQEKGLKPGTENVPAIGAFAEALKEIESAGKDTYQYILELRTHFVERLTTELDFVKIVSPIVEPFSPYIVSLSFEGLKGEVILHSLEMKGIYISTGSACNSKAKVYSHVLNAMELPDSIKEGTVRFSFSRYNTLEEINIAADQIIDMALDLKRIMKRR